MEQPGHLLEKGTLLKAVWPASFVEENNLADNISRLRKALGESENGQKFIETIPKSGYRFVAPVRKQNVKGAEPAVEEAQPPPRGVGELQPKAPDANSPSRPGKRFTAILCALSFLIPVCIAVGLWLDFRVKKRAELDQLEFKGNFFVSRWTEDEVRKGIEYYNRAVALDPKSATAYAGLAVGWNFLSDLHIPPREAMPKAKAAALKALQLNEGLANAHVSLGVVRMQYEWDWALAEQEFQRAIALEPADEPAHRLYGWLLMAVGRFQEAQAELKRTLEGHPLDDFNLWELGLSFYFAHEYEQAIEQYRRAIGVEPRSYWPHMLLGWAYEQQGKFTDAITELNQSSRLSDNTQVLGSLGHAYAASGRHAEAEKVIQELQEIARRKYVSPYDVATIYAGLGQREQTLVWLEKAYEDRSGWLALWVKVDPKFDTLRADPRFRNLLLRVGHAI